MSLSEPECSRRPKTRGLFRPVAPTPQLTHAIILRSSEKGREAGRGGRCYFRRLVEYEGTDFAGFQWQHETRTVQGELERAILVRTGQTLRCRARAAPMQSTCVDRRQLRRGDAIP